MKDHYLAPRRGIGIRHAKAVCHGVNNLQSRQCENQTVHTGRRGTNLGQDGNSSDIFLRFAQLLILSNALYLEPGT